VLSGPPTYFAGFKVPEEAVQRGLEGLMELIRAHAAETIVVDHHLLRDLRLQGEAGPSPSGRGRGGGEAADGRRVHGRRG